MYFSNFSLTSSKTFFFLKLFSFFKKFKTEEVTINVFLVLLFIIVVLLSSIPLSYYEGRVVQEVL